jgi:hypothetical protein
MRSPSEWLLLERVERPTADIAFKIRFTDNRRTTDAAHNQHLETRRPSDRDRIVTTGPSRFQPARPEVLR